MNARIWTHVTSNGPYPHEVATIDELMHVLSREPLDPKFERYGNFIERNPCAGIQAKSGEWIDGDPLFPGEDVTRFHGNFARVSHVFNIDTTDPTLIAKLTDAIRANQHTQAYLEFKALPPSRFFAAKAAQS